ncbi:MAG TPA: hypothetical protein VNT20_07450 [Flavisolibacter sp.]|jgi:hypothetical protein|nr:hypothetical protein [Flavisolibacter sp.]
MSWKNFWEKAGNWELWPFKLRYFLISPVWLWYCLRSRSLWFFSSSNPTLTFGGLDGETKREMYDLLPKEFYPKTIYLSPKDNFEEIKQLIAQNGFTYPFVVKPDVGAKGLLFRKIDDEGELKFYHQKNPVDYIIQDLVTYPLEVSVFYYRYPNEKNGVITGFIQKDLMDVYGDGKSSLWELIMAHPNARHRPDEMRIKHEHNLDKIIPKGERYILTYAANLNRGAKFSDLYQHVDDEMLKLFDELSHRTRFYYGRYDIKCESIEDLRKGKNFTILEFNGSGAEPNHVYQNNHSLFDAYKVFLRHWKVLYEISKYNNNHGVPYWPFMKGWKFLQAAKKNLKLLEEKDTEILV